MPHAEKRDGKLTGFCATANCSIWSVLEKCLSAMQAKITSNSGCAKGIIALTHQATN